MSEPIPRTVPCPICQMPVDTGDCQLVAELEGQSYFFCAEGCRSRFLAERATCCGRPRGRWGRFLARLGRANDEAFGAGGPHCH